jgi:methyl-accepting chemotaxis protein
MTEGSAVAEDLVRTVEGATQNVSAATEKLQGVVMSIGHGAGTATVGLREAALEVRKAAEDLEEASAAATRDVRTAIEELTTVALHVRELMEQLIALQRATRA